MTKSYTKTDEIIITTMWRAGHSAEEIGTTLDRTANAIWTKVGLINFAPRRKRAYLRITPRRDERNG